MWTNPWSVERDECLPQMTERQVRNPDDSQVNWSPSCAHRASLPRSWPRSQPLKGRADVSRIPVLILSDDSLAAALLGAAVDLAGESPFFPDGGESPRVALRRVRPSVILVDCDHQGACSEEFIGPALMTGARVLLVRSRRTETDRTRFAHRLNLVVAELPMEPEAFSELLRASAPARRSG